MVITLQFAFTFRRILCRIWFLCASAFTNCSNILVACQLTFGTMRHWIYVEGLTQNTEIFLTFDWMRSILIITIYPTCSMCAVDLE